MEELFKVYRVFMDNTDFKFVPVSVYNVRDDKHGYPLFLIYDDLQWKYISAKHFIPAAYVKEIIWKYIEVEKWKINLNCQMDALVVYLFY